MTSLISSYGRSSRSHRSNADSFELYGDFALDPKIQILPEVMQRRLVMLFALHSKCPSTDFKEAELALALGISLEALQETKDLFIEQGFIDKKWRIRSFSNRLINIVSFPPLRRAV